MNFLKKFNIRKKIKKKFSNLFKNGKKNLIKKNIILTEFGNSNFNHIAFAYICDIVSQKFNAKVVAFPGYQLLSSNLSQNFLHKVKWKIGNLLSISSFGVHRSFGVSDIFWPKINHEINLKALREFKSYDKTIKSNDDLEKYKIKDILVGDLIYDSFLKKTLLPTLDVGSKEFKFFFLDCLKLFYYWENYFKKHEVKSLVLYHSVYMSALPLRFALVKKIPTYVADIGKLYCLSRKRNFNCLEYLDYKKKFSTFTSTEKKNKLDQAKKILSEKFSGNLSSELYYMSKSAFGLGNKKKLLKKSNRLKILISPHAFCDSPHIFGKTFFPDFYIWLQNLGEISNKTNYDWYIKCHPDPQTYFDNTTDVIKKFVKKYPKITYLKPSSAHNQIINEGIDYVLTVYGTISGEYPYFGVNAINASKNHSQINYKFTITPKNRKEYLDLIKNLKKPNRINKKEEILEHHYMKYVYYNEKWFFNDINNVKDSLNGYKNFFTVEMYQYWIKNFDLEEHLKLYKKVKKFIYSNEYILIN